MTTTPYPITGVIYDMDGTVFDGAAVYVEHKSGVKIETITTTTNSSGEYSLDLANLTSGYTNGDFFYIIATQGQKCAEYKSTIDTVAGSENKDLRMEGRQLIRSWALDTNGDTMTAGVSVASSFAVSNEHASNAKYVIFEDAMNGVQRLKILVPADNTITFPCGTFGLKAAGGIRVLENGTGGIGTGSTASDVDVTVVAQ